MDFQGVFAVLQVVRERGRAEGQLARLADRNKAERRERLPESESATYRRTGARGGLPSSGILARCSMESQRFQIVEREPGAPSTDPDHYTSPATAPGERSGRGNRRGRRKINEWPWTIPTTFNASSTPRRRRSSRRARSCAAGRSAGIGCGSSFRKSRVSVAATWHRSSPSRRWTKRGRMPRTKSSDRG